MSILKEQRAPRAIQNIRRFFPGVDRIADSTAPLVIEVTKGDLAGAKKKSHNACVMAQACERIKGIDGAMIGTTSSYIIKGDLAVRYKTPVSVAREIVSFDRHRDFRVGTYHLAKMHPSAMLGVREQKPDRRKGRHMPTGELKKRMFHPRTEGIRGVGAEPND